MTKNENNEKENNKNENEETKPKKDYGLLEPCTFTRKTKKER